jgi:hypothetical protein
MAMLAREYGRRPKTFERGCDSSLPALRAWPGNVRELATRRAADDHGARRRSRRAICVSSDAGRVHRRARGAGASPIAPLHDARDDFETQYILRALAAQQGNMSRTAECSASSAATCIARCARSASLPRRAVGRGRCLASSRRFDTGAARRCGGGGPRPQLRAHGALLRQRHAPTPTLPRRPLAKQATRDS